LVGLLVLLLTVSVVLFVPVFLNRHTIYPTPETESAFLKSYAAKPAVVESVVAPFMCKRFHSYWSDNMGATAGQEFATHQGGIQGHYTIRAQDWMPVMTALNDDLSAQLVRDGAEILGRSGDPRDGFHYDYKLGKSFGSVTISPLRIEKGKYTPEEVLPEGLVPMALDIALIEKWYPKEPGTMSVRIDTNIR